MGDDSIDTADYVMHMPSKEEWVVACVIGTDLYWCGWPPGSVKVSDCIRTQKATPEDRIKLLKQMAGVDSDDPRWQYAKRMLAGEQP